MTGRQISHYKILARLGKGGMGEIYLAEDIKLKRKAALKFLLPHALLDTEAKKRFINEAQSAAALNHPNICTVYEIDDTENETFIAMEFIDGGTLRDKIANSSLQVKESLDITIQIAEGLREAASKGIIHRDIKSSNIMLTKDGRVKITDFGLAKLKEAKHITRQGATMGTIAYMSPEQILGKEADSRTDIWSLGVVLYEMLTGELPFRGDYEQAIIYSILNEDPAPFDRSAVQIPEEMKKIIEKMLAKDPEQRYGDFNRLLEELNSLAAGGGSNTESKTAKAGASYKKHKRKILNMVLPLPVLLTGMIVFLLLNQKPADRLNIRLLVLPFQNLGNPDEDYFTEGVYEEILSRLSALNGLAVVPRGKAVQYVKQNDIYEIAQNDLGADYIMEGTVKRDKSNNIDRISIIVDLADVKNRELVWSEKYDGILTDIFKVQTDIAEKVAKQLDIKILAPERKAITEVPTTDMDAYDIYRKAYKVIRDAQTLPREKRLGEYNKSLSMMEKAVELDSTFYSAYVSLSHFNSWLYDVGYDRTPERKLIAKKYLDKVLKIRPGYPAARLQLAVYYYRMENDYRRSYDILMELNKEYPNRSQLWLGMVERRLGLWEDAIEHFKEAEKLGPYDDDTPLELGGVYTYMKEFDLADKAYDRSIKNHPNYVYAIEEKSINYILWNGDILRAKIVWNQLNGRGRDNINWLFILRMERNYDELINRISSLNENYIETFTDCKVKPLEYAQAYYLMKDIEKKKLYADSARIFLTGIEDKKAGRPEFHSALGLSYAFLNDEQKAISHGKKAIEICPLEKDALLAPFYLTSLAKIYSVLNKKEKAVELLSKLSSIPSQVSKAYLKIEPMWDNLRGSKKFQKLIED